MASIDYFRQFKERESYIAGQTICRAGDVDGTLYAVREGAVGLLYGDAEIEIVQPGDVVGVFGAFDDGPHVLTAYAHTDCVITPVHKRKMLLLLHETPMFAIFIMRTTARRARLMAELAPRSAQN